MTHRRCGWLLCAVMLSLLGCQRAARAPESEPATALVDDGSRCEHTGRDLESLETRVSAAKTPNVRRVFRLSSNKRDAQRVLVCREVDTNLDGRKDVFREFDSRGQVTRESADANYDGRLDTWSSFAGGRLRKLELDLDGDGQINETRFYNAGVNSQLQLAKIQRDTNRDTKPDRWEAYEKGRLSRIGLDQDFDGVVDRWLQGEVSSETTTRPTGEKANKGSQTR